MTSNIVYRSKIGLEIVIPIVLILGALTIFEIITAGWIAITISGLIWLLLINIYATTYYKITTDQRLIIKSWIVECWVIDIKDIVAITKNNPVSNSSAISLTRLEIIFRDGNVLISPNNKKQFINALRKVNSKIQG